MDDYACGYSPEEFQAVLRLFEGEARISEKETGIVLEKTLRVWKLCNQKYLEREIAVTRERIGS